jgi:hypothetical protein
MVHSDINEERRAHNRFKAPILWRMTRFPLPPKQVIDISQGGLRIYGDSLFEVGEQFALELLFPNKTVAACKVRVQWYARLPAKAAADYEVGLQFVDLSAESLELIQAVIGATI